MFIFRTKQMTSTIPGKLFKAYNATNLWIYVYHYFFIWWRLRQAHV